MTLDRYTIYDDMLNTSHLLVAGATGTGKSVVINGMIYNALFKSPKDVAFILIDPKRVELVDYKALPHTLKYASEPGKIADALRYAVDIMEHRYKEMQRAHIKKSDKRHIYVVIDELADLMTTNRKQCENNIIRLAQLGRAANIHLIAATQNCTQKVINTQLKSNFANRIALRTAFKYESNNIIGVSGCEALPPYGKGYFLRGCECDLIDIPMTPEENIKQLIEYWT